MRRTVVLTMGGLLAANAAAWGWALFAFGGSPALLGTAVLAYSFGLRHALDADHIAAIDSAARKLIQHGRQPATAGLFFSLGHSTLVVIASLGVALASEAVQGRLGAWKELAALVGTAASALFLLLLALANLAIFVSVLRAFRRARAGLAVGGDDPDLLLAPRGLLARLFRPILRLVTASWHMAPVGFLFGLGFDTATEVAVLAISANAIAHGLSIGDTLIFPALFAAGMSLVDTADSALMAAAYDWAFRKPIRRLYYNVTITLISVLVALLVGGIEALGLIADQLSLRGGLGDLVAGVTDSFGMLGYAIVGVFLLSWLIAAAVYRLRGYDLSETTASTR